MIIDYTDKTLVARFDAILSRGLCTGVGTRDGQMCIEAAVCAVLDLPHGDNPECVEPAVRAFKIRLNDSRWSSTQARATGLRDLGLAQLGSRGVVNGREFSKRVVEQTIRVLLPKLFRELFPGRYTVAVDKCEREGTAESARALSRYAAAADAYADAYAAAAAAAAAYAADAAAADAYAYAADAYAADAYAADAADAADAAKNGDTYLLLSAAIALQVLKDLKSPGCAFLEDK